MKDALGDRMKGHYENRCKHFFPRRLYTLIRLDGKSFHSYTKRLKKPFDLRLMADMNWTAQYLCKEIMGAEMAYIQSDEITILLTDFRNINSEPWFNGNQSKIESVSASLATGYFNYLRWGLRDVEKIEDGLKINPISTKIAAFDSRAWVKADPFEVENEFIWRQQDWTRNSINLAASSVYSHKELQNKSNSDKQDMLMEKGINWNNYSAGEKRGRMVIKEDREWKIIDAPIFTSDRNFLRSRIPMIGGNGATLKDYAEMVQNNSRSVN